MKYSKKMLIVTLVILPVLAGAIYQAIPSQTRTENEVPVTTGTSVVQRHERSNGVEFRQQFSIGPAKDDIWIPTQIARSHTAVVAYMSGVTYSILEKRFWFLKRRGVKGESSSGYTIQPPVKIENGRFHITKGQKVVFNITVTYHPAVRGSYALQTEHLQWYDRENRFHSEILEPRNNFRTSMYKFKF